MITNPTIYWCFLGLQLLSHHLHGDLLLAAGGAHAVEGGGQVLHKQGLVQVSPYLAPSTLSGSWIGMLGRVESQAELD